MAQDRTRGDGEMLDAVVIGGSFAGISAALYLARGRRSVAVVDEGETRNRFASAAHGLLGHDGKPPAQIRAEGLRDLLAYPEARLIAGRALRVPELTLLPDGLLSEQDHATLTSAGVRVAAAAPVRLQSDGPRLQVIHLSDGRTLPAEVLYMATRAEPACDLAAQLGCRMEMGMQGPIVAVDAMQASSVPGVFAAGDLARPVFGAGFAVAAGVMAGTACHRSLVLG